MTSRYASKDFWIDVADRAISTTAQAAIGVLTAGVTGILQVDPIQLASVAGLAGAVSVLTSVAFRGRGEPAPAVLTIESQTTDSTPRRDYR